jgi:hypothetical protein
MYRVYLDSAQRRGHFAYGHDAATKVRQCESLLTAEASPACELLDYFTNNRGYIADAP